MTEPLVMIPAHRIFVAGHRGLVGSAIVRRLRALGYENLVLRSHAEVDLCDAGATRVLFETERPEFVFMAAARVGGIVANDTYPADFIRENLAVQLSVLAAAQATGVRKLLFLGSSCIYPRLAPQPIPEEALMSGPLEPTNDAYAIAKISGIIMCKAYNRQFGTRFMSIIPTNLYGPGDNFGLQTSHVVPALIRKFHDARRAGAREVVVWGTGRALREFLHVDDMADASVHLMRAWGELDADGKVTGGSGALDEIVNVGYGSDMPISALANHIREIVGFPGEIVFDTTMPDGTPRKLLDSSRLQATGWRPAISVEDGLRSTYEWFLRHHADARQ